MLSSLKKLALATVIVALPLVSAAEHMEMDPAPADRSKYEYKKEPGKLKRTKYGMIDPSPDVISLEYLPKDAYGFVDWTKAIKDKIIDPRDTLKGDEKITPQQVPDVVIKSKMEFMPDVLFPHSVHTTWLKCSNCHPKIFRDKAGATPITMVGIWQGEFCGRCHDKVAFPTRNCHKCHSLPRKNTKAGKKK